MLSLLVCLISGIGADVSSAKVKNNAEQEELTAMSTKGLEELLIKVKQEIADGKVAKLSPVATSNLAVKQHKILSEITKR